MARTVQGKTNTWRLGDKPIGSGDAGEVFTAACVDQPEITGVLKKPARIATGGTLQRQAGQIAQEGLALARLNGLPDCKAHPPRLLDQALDFTSGTADFFIVSEVASGENLAEMLNQSRIHNRPFPRRVIITVLDSLFDLFARAHRVGILWNDVKLDHIYWHNASGDVTVIDWGNAVFLEEQSEGHRRILPRWEDYRQLVDTLGNFLQQNAPELFDDLGWYEFLGQELNLTSVSVLARRIAYQKEVIALSVMEYQALIQVVLATEPSSTGLKNIHSYQKKLEQIGAPWFSPEVLGYARRLVEIQLAQGDHSGAVRTTTVVWDLFGESLALPWYLVREYFQQTDLLTHPKLSGLIKFTFAEQWPEVLWTLALIGRDLGVFPGWDRLVPVIRQEALATVSPTPYQIGKSVLSWASAEGDPDRIDQLQRIMKGWRQKGDNLKSSPFEYELLDLARSDSSLPRQIQSVLKRTFSIGEEAIQELLLAWVKPDWNNLPKTLRRLLSWDPDRWGILRLAEILDEVQAWIQQMSAGPQGQETIRAFTDSMLATVPPVDRLLGNAEWFNAMIQSLKAIHQGAPVRDFLPAVRTWYPWLLSYTNISETKVDIHKPNAREVKAVLNQFVQHLKTWSDIDSGLTLVRNGAPDDFPFCKCLADGFQSVIALTTNLERLEQECSNLPNSNLTEPCKVLMGLISWRRLIFNGNFDEALDILSDFSSQGWRISIHAGEETLAWKDEINPILKGLIGFDIPSNGNAEPGLPLTTAARAVQDIKFRWDSIYDSGLHQRLLEILEESIDTARVAFFQWRHEMETHPDRIKYLLYHSQLVRIRALSDILLKLSLHIHKARISQASLGNGNKVPFEIQLKYAENLLDHLSAIEEILVLTEEKRRFPTWRRSFQTVQAAETMDLKKVLALDLASDHPLYSWLVQSLLAK